MDVTVVNIALASIRHLDASVLSVAILGAVVAPGLHGSVHDNLATATLAGRWLMVALGAAIVRLGTAASTPGARASAGRTAERLREAPAA